jgi:hypothetical protein
MSCDSVESSLSTPHPLTLAYVGAWSKKPIMEKARICKVNLPLWCAISSMRE